MIIIAFNISVNNRKSYFDHFWCVLPHKVAHIVVINTLNWSIVNEIIENAVKW